MTTFNHDICWTSTALTIQPIRALVLSFHGMNNPGNFEKASSQELAWAAKGALIAKPACGPWSFMNADTVRFIDDLIPQIRAEFELSPALPLIITGGSMGGCAALTYTALGAEAPQACIALEPVADFDNQLSQSTRMQRVFEVAFGYENWRTVIAERSPHRLLDRYPDIPYLLAHGPNDPLIDGTRTKALAERMQEHGLQVAYHEHEHYGHQHHLPIPLLQAMDELVDTIVQEHSEVAAS